MTENSASQRAFTEWFNFVTRQSATSEMVAILRKVLDVVAHWPEHRKIGPLLVPPFLAEKHGHTEGDVPTDALLEDLALHYAWTVYHPTPTCRIGGVVNPQLQVAGVDKLRVADASVMPNVVSGNTNAASMMIGEKPPRCWQQSTASDSQSSWVADLSTASYSHVWADATCSA